MKEKQRGAQKIKQKCQNGLLFIQKVTLALQYIYTRSDKVLRAAPWGIESPRLTNSPLAKRDLEEYLFNECAFHMQP
ncbi:TPA: hypothetical protein G8D40_001509 [Salmonella enterica]|uniref:Uncharacterized protein n=3 Tax=Salmonella enterica TaxID=28901 RepID=A0A3Z1X1J2_SALET|nr:hypothetical protein [Salmonella enterica subsp. enterica serovar Kiambu]EAM1130471.1 hypothetical protein [Salmonella enterica]EBP3313666.1 hypothetical protein [Salmonella enterica subsp. enterica]EAM6148700.1 hypothetical protein [Salmonella enterica]EAM8378539.1 hypothetical protein [Salmonella enterica]